MSTTEVTATDASRRFADLLDGVEHRGDRYTIVRRGRAIARLEPATGTSGASAKARLIGHQLDRAWVADNDALRDGLIVEEKF